MREPPQEVAVAWDVVGVREAAAAEHGWARVSEDNYCCPSCAKEMEGARP